MPDTPILGPGGTPLGEPPTPASLLDSRGNPLTRPIPPAAAADMGFLTKARVVLNVAQASTKPAKFAAGLGWVAMIVDVLALLNTGNPYLFSAKSSDWVNVISREVTLTWADMQASYEKEILPIWQGDAQKALDTYLNKQIKGANDAIRTLSDQFATALGVLSSQILTSDFEALAVGVASAVMINSLFALDLATEGAFTPALVTAIITYALAVLAWLRGIGTLFESFSAQLTTLQTKANDITAAIWADAGRQDPSRVALDPNVTAAVNLNDNYWKHNPVLDTT